jgi:hypothetical protein
MIRRLKWRYRLHVLLYLIREGGWEYAVAEGYRRRWIKRHDDVNLQIWLAR